MKIVAIIQARMNSSRLPGKVLADINGRTILQCLLERVKAVREIDKVVVATSLSIEDDILEIWLKKNNILFFRGSENDVLERYYLCSKRYMADVIVRITADDPLKDPVIISHAITTLVTNPIIDYCSNTIIPSYPEGLDIEVLKFSSLEKAYNEATLKSDREHVTPYIWKSPNIFNTLNFSFERDLSSWRWTVDKPVDLVFIRKIYAHFDNDPLVPFSKIVEYIDMNPHIRNINTGTIRNEGYLKSLSVEKL